MSLNIKKILACNIIITILSIGVCISVILNEFSHKIQFSECVPTETEAIIIGKTICEKLYPEFDYTQYNWDCLNSPDDESWKVFCDSGKLGGGLPEIHIKKSNGEVLWIGLGV